LVYLSLSPLLYKTVGANMAYATFRPRVLMEKPVGTNAAGAEEIYDQLRSAVAEEDIYFVDHYLAKDWVQGLRTPPVPQEKIARVEIHFFETIGVEKRGALYDHLGALRDVGQNHMLQIVASLLGFSDALEQLPILSSTDVAAQTVRAQYEGYRTIPGVAVGSMTETYFKVRTTLSMEGWHGVELTLEAGKALPHSLKEVVLICKDGRTVTLPEFQNTDPEYEMLLSAAMRGDKTLFPSMRDIRAQWRFIDPIVEAWSAGATPLVLYTPGAMPQA
jgi:glucose-6-phosphate 1-dehydrogenase